MSHNLAVRISVAPDVLLQEMQGESVLLNLNTGKYFGLDAVGTRMWSACTTTPSLKDALGALLDQYDVEPNRLQQDLQDLIDKLVENGLVIVSP